MSAVQTNHTEQDLHRLDDDCDLATARRTAAWWTVSGYRGTTESFDVATYREASKLADRLASLGYVCIEARKRYGSSDHAPDCAVTA